MQRRRKLEGATQKSVKKGHADGTRENHRSHHRAYLRFCDEYAYEYYPADDWRLCMYAQYLFQQGKRPGTVDNHISSIRVIHRMAGMNGLNPTDIHYKLLSDGLKRQCKVPVRQACPIKHENLRSIFEKIDLTIELNHVAWTAILVGFNLVLRVSNLGPSTRKLFDPSKNLLRLDLQMKEGCLAIGIRWSKNNQFRNRVQWAPVVMQQEKKLCPQYWLQRMVHNVPAEPHEPLFLVTDQNSRHPLTSSQINRLLKEWCGKAALDPK